jgi:hypothetical protein
MIHGCTFIVTSNQIALVTAIAPHMLSVFRDALINYSDLLWAHPTAFENGKYI